MFLKNCLKCKNLYLKNLVNTQLHWHSYTTNEQLSGF